ncbi:MAG: RDD family protein [Actinobacteria bacterium]|nr:RDD family protein [Actinomycetota bacterium]
MAAPAPPPAPVAAEHGQSLRATAADGAEAEEEVAWTAAEAPGRASWARRAAALGLDQLSIWTVTLALLVPSILVFGENSDIPILFLSAGFVVAMVLVGIVPVRQGAREGQTFGKQVLDIRVVPEAAGRLSFRRLVVRELMLKNVVFGLPCVFLLGVPALVNYLWPLWDRRSRTLHDHLCATRVLTDLPT